MNIRRCSVTPIDQHSFSFRVDGFECTRWNFGKEYPRPFFYPIQGPSGGCLTRMGHPGAANHDHHRSIWFAHQDLYGHDFWSEGSPCRIEQREWYAIEENDQEAMISVGLDWLDGHNPKPLLKQDVTSVVSRGPYPGGWKLELQSTFIAEAEGIEFRKSNFGILGIRVAKTISEFFGDGEISGSDGRKGEPATFGEPNRWIDYSGSVYVDASNRFVRSGLTLLDHPENPFHPARWHTRVDGWFGPSLSRLEPVPLTVGKPLTVRYLLLVHAGPYDAAITESAFTSFSKLPPVLRVRSRGPHRQWELTRNR